MTTFDKAAATALLQTAFAPWVRDLDLSIDSISADGVVLRMAFSQRICRDNGVISGQSLMALADTAAPLAISAAAGRYMAMTTVDQTSHFLKPAANADVLADAQVRRLGRTMAFVSVTLRTANDPRPVALAQIAYALLGEEKKG